jgi:hypothetical protein
MRRVNRTDSYCLAVLPPFLPSSACADEDFLGLLSPSLAAFALAL